MSILACNKMAVDCVFVRIKSITKTAANMPLLRTAGTPAAREFCVSFARPDGGTGRRGSLPEFYL